MLRDYQQKTIDDLWDWFSKNPTGHPCLVLPTGAGKSHIVAALCKQIVQSWPDTRLLMLTSVKELIEQNAEKMRQHWPNAPLGIYSASLRQKDISQITFAGIQSVSRRADQLGHIDMVIVDECHQISHKDQGGYRKLIAALTAINPSVRVVGLTATPFRLGHGYIHEGDDTLFDDLIEPILIEDLIHQGYLSPLRSRATDVKLSTDGVHKRGGEFIADELNAAVNTTALNWSVVEECIALGHARKSWLFFCVSVEHAQSVTSELIEHGIAAACVTGETPSGERDAMIKSFKSGSLRALVNVNVLTTGFDAPNTDMIAMLRPTLSPALYIQMAGRGLRLKDHADDCLVLDFAGNVARHGPITCVQPPNKAGKGQAPVRICPDCEEIMAAALRTCPNCGLYFGEPEPKESELRLHGDDIMGGIQTMTVSSVVWSVHTSKTSGIQMLKARFYGALTDLSVDAYYGVYSYDDKPHYRNKCRQTVSRFLLSEWDWLSSTQDDIARLCQTLHYDNHHPNAIEYKRNGKFYNIISMI